jgi:hypothetical protein
VAPRSAARLKPHSAERAIEVVLIIGLAAIVICNGPCSGHLLRTRGLLTLNLDPGVMIEKIAGAQGRHQSEFLDLNHTRSPLILVSLLITKLARAAGINRRRAS